MYHPGCSCARCRTESQFRKARGISAGQSLGTYFHLFAPLTEEALQGSIALSASGQKVKLEPEDPR